MLLAWALMGTLPVKQMALPPMDEDTASLLKMFGALLVEDRLEAVSAGVANPRGMQAARAARMLICFIVTSLC